MRLIKMKIEWVLFCLFALLLANCHSSSDPRWNQKDSCPLIREYMEFITKTVAAMNDRVQTPNGSLLQGHSLSEILLKLEEMLETQRMIQQAERKETDRSLRIWLQEMVARQRMFQQAERNEIESSIYRVIIRMEELLAKHERILKQIAIMHPAQIVGQATCDNEMKLYADGKLVTSHDNWTTAREVKVSSETEVIGIECKDLRVAGGIRAHFNNGINTDSSWRCSATFTEGWNQPGFDASTWALATELPESHHANKMYDYPSGFPVSSRWIWTPNYLGGDRLVYCINQ